MLSKCGQSGLTDNEWANVRYWAKADMRIAATNIVVGDKKLVPVATTGGIITLLGLDCLTYKGQ
jgi:hypothetical protein